MEKPRKLRRTLQRSFRVRKSVSRGSPSFQLGHYEMIGEPGKRRSAFVVDVHLGEHPTPESALEAWPPEIERLRAIGRDRRADSLETKLEKLTRLRELEHLPKGAN